MRHILRGRASSSRQQRAPLGAGWSGGHACATLKGTGTRIWYQRLRPHLEWLPVVEAAFYNLNLAGNLASFTEKIDAVNLERLRFCGLQIADRFGEPELAKEEIARVAREIEELIAEIKESPIDENARQYALHHLFQIAQALREYELFGAERIREEASTAIGSAFFQYKDAQGVGTKYWDLISKVCVLLQTGAAVVYIEQFTRSLLGK